MYTSKVWLVIATGQSINSKMLELRALSNTDVTTIGVHNLDRKIIPDYHLFVGVKRYKAYKDMVSSKSVLVVTQKIIDNIPGVVRITVKNKYPSDKGMIQIVGDRIICEGASGGVIAAAFAIMCGAKTVLMAGIDGYSDGSKHHYKEKENKWERLMQHESATPMILNDLSKLATIKIITPTVYKEYYDSSVLNKGLS